MKFFRSLFQHSGPANGDINPTTGFPLVDDGVGSVDVTGTSFGMEHDMLDSSGSDMFSDSSGIGDMSTFDSSSDFGNSWD
ncbi:MAG: hypothetical protein ABI304_11550 [Rudaea sp.]